MLKVDKIHCAKRPMLVNKKGVIPLQVPPPSQVEEQTCRDQPFVMTSMLAYKQWIMEHKNKLSSKTYA
jgi:hypothetical protein